MALATLVKEPLGMTAKCRRLSAVFAIVFVLALLHPEVHAQQNPNRLVVDNRTQYVIDLYGWNGQAWYYVTRIAPATWYPVVPVQNGQLFRAAIGPNNFRDHQVQLGWDPNYSGYQDVWWVQ